MNNLEKERLTERDWKLYIGTIKLYIKDLEERNQRFYEGREYREKVLKLTYEEWVAYSRGELKI